MVTMIDKRSINTEHWIGSEDENLAQLAAKLSERGMDTYSGYGVGAVIVVDYTGGRDAVADEFKKHNTHIYGGFNINLSGMEYKVHAEQLALFQAMLDMEISGLFSEPTLEKVVVVTTGNDHSLVCGHCLQVFNGVSDHYNWDIENIDYISAAYEGNEDKPENYHKSDWDFEKFTLDELLGKSYVSNKE